METKNFELDIKDDNSNISPANLIDINTKLHMLVSNELDHFEPGNIYIQPLADLDMVTEIVKNTFKKNRC